MRRLRSTLKATLPKPLILALRNVRSKAKLPKGLSLALRNVRSEVRIWKLHRGGVQKARTLYTGRRELKLNVGCGPNYKKGWVNIDLSQKVDLSLDMRETYCPTVQQA